MRETGHHVDDEDLERYSMGTISPESSVLVEEHLLMCEACRDRLRETDSYLPDVRGASAQWRRDQRTVDGRGWRWPAWHPAFAAAACGLVLMVIALRMVRSHGPAVAVSLSALRGIGAGSSAPAGRDLDLHPDLTGLSEAPSYRLEIVDQTGRPVREGTLVRAQFGIKVPGLDAGLYFVRVYLPAGELLREYGLQIQ
jgi:hypothetical protein